MSRCLLDDAGSRAHQHINILFVFQTYSIPAICGKYPTVYMYLKAFFFFFTKVMLSCKAFPFVCSFILPSTVSFLSLVLEFHSSMQTLCATH